MVNLILITVDGNHILQHSDCLRGRRSDSQIRDTLVSVCLLFFLIEEKFAAVSIPLPVHLRDSGQFTLGDM